MNNLKYLFHPIIFLLLLCTPLILSAQSVGIGTPTPNSFSILDVSSPDKGLLIPRLALTNTTSVSPVGNFVAGMVIYNTVTTGDVTPGYYGCDGTKWVRLVSNPSWLLTGNSGTNPATHFIGTTDAQDVIFKWNNIRAGLIGGSNTSFGVNALNPATTGLANTAIGSSSLLVNTTGSSNTAVGIQALKQNTSGNLNIAVGRLALEQNTTGESNIGIGDRAVLKNSIGNFNIGIGFNTMRENIAGSYGIAIGSEAMYGINATTSPFENTNIAIGREALYGGFPFTNNTGLANNAIGYKALSKNTSGSRNNAMGTESLYSNNTGNGNVALGSHTLYYNTTQSGLVAIGDSALYNNGVGATLAFHAVKNTAIGSQALRTNTTGFENTATGFSALYNNQDGYRNTANGFEALKTNTSGFANTAYGYKALNDNISGNGNIGIGSEAGFSTTVGNQNISIGSYALGKNINGNDNIAIGHNAMVTNTSGYSNVALGSKALFRNNTQSNLVAVGDSALYNNGLGTTAATQAVANTAVGSKALYNNTRGHSNTANGFNALYTNQFGVSNTANGHLALYFNTGSNNTAVGTRAMHLNNNGNGNVAIGETALRTGGGNYNTAIGYSAGNNSTGSGNVFIGVEAGSFEAGNNKLYINNDNGNADNTLIYGEFDNKKLRINNFLGIGRQPSFWPLEIKGTGSGNELVQFFNTSNVAKWHLNLKTDGSLNFVETSVADHRLVLGVGGEIGVGKVPLTSANDSRLVVKQKSTQNGFGIEAATSANHWDFWVDNTSLNLNYYLNGVLKGAFNATSGAYTNASDRRLKKDIVAYEPVLNKLNQLHVFNYHYLDNANTDPLSSGFMAQDVQKIFPEAVSSIDSKNGDKYLGINYQYFTVVAIKGLQEQQEIIEIEKLKVNNLEEKIAKLEALVNQLIKK
jgi:trimeric autotransporter adhesin